MQTNSTEFANGRMGSINGLLGAGITREESSLCYCTYTLSTSFNCITIIFIHVHADGEKDADQFQSLSQQGEQ